MNPWIQAALILAAFLSVVAVLSTWMIFWITADLKHGWSKWITIPLAAAPLTIAIYAAILHGLTT
jgi:hypothetical protein